MKKKTITYKQAGVDMEAGDKAVEKIKKLVRTTFSKSVLSGVGFFGAGFEIEKKKYKNPVLVSGADGVGSKLKIAIKLNKHDTVGIDLVAMNVDDVVTMGAKPLFLLDYIACHKLEPDMVASLVAGMVKGCKQSGCALIGGETAEMPDLYKKGDYDLAAFAVGIVEKSKIIDGSKVKPGDAIIGLASSGLHSNGYALARKVLLEIAGFSTGSRIDGLKNTLGEELLIPTRIYAKSLLSLIDKMTVKGIAHITGGGIPGNTCRVLPKGTKAVIYRSRWEPPLIFKLIKGYGSINDQEMFNTFNMGIGMVVVVSKKDAAKAMAALKKLGEKPIEIGEIGKGSGEVEVI